MQPVCSAVASSIFLYLKLVSSIFFMNQSIEHADGLCGSKNEVVIHGPPGHLVIAWYYD